jgi:hypothetical protein
VSDRSPRRDFRVLSRRRGGYDGEMHDVQLQVVAIGAFAWAQPFSEMRQATAFEEQLHGDLDALDDAASGRKYGVPASA